MIEAISKVLEKSDLADLAPVVSDIATINSMGEGEMVRMHDEIAFKLLEDNGISTEGKSKEDLEDLMTKAYNFIDEHWDYFGLEIDGKNTVYEIDNDILQSDNKTRTFKKHVKQYKGALILTQRGLHPIFNVDEKTLKYETYLRDYEKRRKKLNEDFRKSVKK